MKRSCMLGLGLLLFPANAFAQETQTQEPVALAPVEEAPPPQPKREELPMERLRVNGGLKIGYVGTRGFDTYADSNTLPQFSLDATYMLWSSGRLGLAAGLGWDVGGRGDELRGLDTSLTIHRFLVPLEARVGLRPWVWAFGKVSPGAMLALAEIKDASSPQPLTASGWAFATDISAGATFAFGPRRKADRKSVRFLMTPEIGYSITSAAPLRPNPGREDDELLGSDQDTNLRSVALSGFFWRTTVGVAW
jgi:hypothetical protein